MSIKIKAILLIIIIIFLFPQKVKAEKGYVSYINFDENGNEIWATNELDLENNLSKEEISTKIFENLLNDKNEMFIPEGTKLLTLVINDGHLVLNVSDEIKNYGGCYYELCLKKQIIKTALSIPNINKVTLLIENSVEYLPEGSFIVNETSW